MLGMSRVDLEQPKEGPIRRGTATRHVPPAGTAAIRIERNQSERNERKTLLDKQQEKHPLKGLLGEEEGGRTGKQQQQVVGKREEGGGSWERGDLLGCFSAFGNKNSWVPRILIFSMFWFCKRKEFSGMIRGIELVPSFLEEICRPICQPLDFELNRLINF